MQLKSLLLAAFAGTAQAGFDIEEGISFSAKDDAQLASMTKAFASSVSAYASSITTASDYTIAWDVLRAYQQTGKDVPAVVTATDGYTVYSTTPDWYKSMPTEAKSFFDNGFKKEKEIMKNIQDDVNKKNDGSRNLGSGLYLTGAVVAGVAGAVAML